jgi:hypothetical protein
MLNELHSLFETLDGKGIPLDTWHREYKELPKATAKAPCFRVWISGSGSITEIATLDPELVNVLRKYGNKLATFPAFNIKPLYRITHEGQKRENNWLKSMAWLDKSLEAITGKFMIAIGSKGEDEKAIVVKLVKAVQTLSQR